MIKTIIFDLGGVVFESDGGSYETRDKIAEELGINQKELHDIWFKRKDDLIKGRMSEEDYVKEIIDHFNLNLSIEEIKSVIRKFNVLDNEVIEIIKSLKKHYPLAVLNNEIKEWNNYRIKYFRLRDYFPLIISSCDYGLAKPEKEIYQLLLKKTKTSPSETLFIDNRKENLVPAEELGIKVFHFTDAEGLKNYLKEERILN